MTSRIMIDSDYPWLRLESDITMMMTRETGLA